MDPNGSIALITGGGHRLGRAITLALAQSGADVVITYHRSADAAEGTARDVRALGRRALVVQADVAEPTDVERLLGAVREVFGHLDLFVANAGVFRRTPLNIVVDADWEDMLRGNLATFLVPARPIGRAMCDRGRGCIVALADVAAIQPWIDYAPYSLAKWGVMAATRALAVELAPTVRVNAIAPGPILTPSDQDEEAYRREIDRTLLRRPGNPRDIADAVLFLARNEYVTGVTLPIDGGRLLT